LFRIYGSDEQVAINEFPFLIDSLMVLNKKNTTKSPSTSWRMVTDEAGTRARSSGFGVPGGNCFLSSAQSGFCSAVVK